MAHYDCDKCGESMRSCNCPEEAIGKSSAQSATAPSPTNATSTEQSSASVEENSSDGCATPQPEKPAMYSIWRHKSGTHYVVIGYTNEHADDANDPNSRYPLTIRYADIDGREWSRPLSKWHDSMTLTNVGVTGMADNVLRKINPWYQGITEACVVSCMQWHFDNPRQTINDLINWHVQVALDPKVSSDAQALIQRGRDEVHNSVAAAPMPDQSVSWRAVKEDLLRVVNSVLRYPVPGGWLIVVSGHPTFIPDPTHSWE